MTRIMLVLFAFLFLLNINPAQAQDASPTPGPAVVVTVVGDCADGIDNDGDGLIDGDDLDCTADNDGLEWTEPVVTLPTAEDLAREASKNPVDGGARFRHNFGFQGMYWKSAGANGRVRLDWASESWFHRKWAVATFVRANFQGYSSTIEDLGLWVEVGPQLTLANAETRFTQQLRVGGWFDAFPASGGPSLSYQAELELGHFWETIALVSLGGPSGGLSTEGVSRIWLMPGHHLMSLGAFWEGGSTRLGPRVDLRIKQIVQIHAAYSPFPEGHSFLFGVNVGQLTTVSPTVVSQ